MSIASTPKPRLSRVHFPPTRVLRVDTFTSLSTCKSVVVSVIHLHGHPVRIGTLTDRVSAMEEAWVGDKVLLPHRVFHYPGHSRSLPRMHGANQDLTLAFPSITGSAVYPTFRAAGQMPQTTYGRLSLFVSSCRIWWPLPPRHQPVVVSP